MVVGWAVCEAGGGRWKVSMGPTKRGTALESDVAVGVSYTLNGQPIRGCRCLYARLFLVKSSKAGRGGEKALCIDGMLMQMHESKLEVGMLWKLGCLLVSSQCTAASVGRSVLGSQGCRARVTSLRRQGGRAALFLIRWSKPTVRRPYPCKFNGRPAAPSCRLSSPILQLLVFVEIPDNLLAKLTIQETLHDFCRPQFPPIYRFLAPGLENQFFSTHSWVPRGSTSISPDHPTRSVRPFFEDRHGRRSR